MASVDASQLTAEELRQHVQRGLESLRKGEYFTEFGLSEDEIILEDGAKLPDKSDKRSLFFSFLNAVATEVVKDVGGGKKKKRFFKEVVDRLQVFQDQWAALILGKGSDAAAVDGGGGEAAESASMKIVTKVVNSASEEKATPKPAKKASKKRKLKEETIDSDDDEELLDDEPEPGVNKESVPIKVRDAASQARWLKRKADFENVRDEVLDQVPEKVKQRFGQICFSKWGKEMLPVLVLSPYDVPPGAVRDMWFAMYKKVKEANRLANMTNLVYWYGAYADPPNAFSFIVSSKLVSYNDGVKKGYDKLPKAMQKKLDAGDGKPLPAGLKQEVRALEEMKQDLEKEPHARTGLLLASEENYNEWDDDNEDDSDSELLDDDPIDDHASPPKVKRQKKTKTKADGDNEEKTKVNPKSKAKSKKKSMPVEDENEPEPQPKKKAKSKKKDTKATAIVDDMADIGDNELDEEAKAPQRTEDAEGLERPQVEVAAPPPVPHVQKIDEEPISTDEDKDDEGYGESESEPDNDDDADFDAVTSLNKKSLNKKSKPKKKKNDAKEAPKKKVIKTKTKIDSKVITKKKKAPGRKKLKEMEQAKFEELENKFLRLIQKWEQAIETQDAPKLNMILSELLTKVEDFSAPFVEEYNIPKMVKKTKLVEGHNIETRRQLWGKMKELYEKKKESVPEGFVAIKRSDVPKAKKAAKSVVPKNEEATPEAPPESTEAIGAEEGVKMEDSQESIPAPSLSSPVKRNGSLEQMVPSERKAEPKISKAVAKPERKRFSLGSLGMGRVQSALTEPKLVSKSSTERTSLSGQAAQKKIPTWISEASIKETPADENRSFALEFLQQAAPFIPSNKNVNYDAIARGLEEAIYDWARGLYKEAWVDKYWEKVHDLVASISGKDGAGTLSTMISEGRYVSASEVVKLSEEALLCSFEGRPII